MSSVRVLLKIFVALLLLKHAQTYAMTCSNVLVPQGYSVNELHMLEGVDAHLTHDRFNVLQDGGVEYAFIAYLNKKGVLHLGVRLRGRTDSGRSVLRGSRLYKTMIEHFGVTNIHQIKGVWWPSGDNYQQYYKALAEGKSKEDAAFSTWSGKQARKYGFTVLEKVPSDESVELKFYFRKPNLR